MDLLIDKLNLSLTTEELNSYKKKVKRKIEMFPFVHRCEVKIKNHDIDYEVAIFAFPEKAPMIFAKSIQQSLNQALNEALAKMAIQLEKYKEVHYHGRNSGHKAIKD